MCWMTIRQEQDALAHGLVETRRAEPHSGGHSWGYAFAEDGDIQMEHGLGEIPDDLNPSETDNALVHTRLATRGEVTIGNAHPFEIEQDGEVVAAMAHNGTWIDAPRHDLYSDSWFMARVFESYLKNEDFEDALEMTADRIKETMVVLRDNGDLYAYSGRFDITSEDSVVQSSHLEDIPTGDLVRIRDGEAKTIARLSRTRSTTEYVTVEFKEP